MGPLHGDERAQRRPIRATDAPSRRSQQASDANKYPIPLRGFGVPLSLNLRLLNESTCLPSYQSQIEAILLQHKGSFEGIVITETNQGMGTGRCGYYSHGFQMTLYLPYVGLVVCPFNAPVNRTCTVELCNNPRLGYSLHRVSAATQLQYGKRLNPSAAS